MITLNASGGSVTFTFDGNSTYLNDGTITVPVNSLALIIDESNMATFRKAASNDIFVSANIAEFGMTKDELMAWYKENMVGSTGGGVDSGTVQTMIDEAVSGKMDTSAYTVDASVNSASTNPVQNQALYNVLSYIYSQLPYSSVIDNGDFEGNINNNFFSYKNGTRTYCSIQDGIGKDNSRGIVLTNETGGDAFSYQLFVKMNRIIPIGTKFHVEFDYKANKVINGVTTQSHGNPPENYIYWDCIGSINFTDQWQHFSKTVTVSSDMGGSWNKFQTIAFELGATADAEYYFDNFVITVEQKL